MNCLLRHKKFSTEFSSDQMIPCNITMLSSIGTMELNGNGTTLCCSSQYASAPMAPAL